ncbi:MAG TPA: hypothetical protein VK699_14000 [Terriglobales bacterium]|nr:hypothetical protein [Terriglobales bacterium]
MIRLLITLAILLAIPVYAQHPKTLQKPVSTDTVECGDEDMPASNSAVVLSPSGLQAKLRLQAKTVKAKSKDDWRCATTWTLLVNRRGTPLRTVFQEQRDDEWGNESSFEIDGWSEDGRFLLLSTATMAGDWDETTPVIYDAEKNKSYAIKLAPLFEALTPKDCLLYFRPLGFNASSQVLLDVGDLNYDRAPGEKACFPESRWELDYIQKRVKRVSGRSVPQKFGKVASEK